jgi:hypothetical protein
MASDEVMRANIAAAVQRVDVIQVSVDAGHLLVHWLGQLADIGRQRNGCAPIGLVEVQHAIAEAVAAGCDSRRRESEGLVAPEVLALNEEPVMNLKDAAWMLELKPDSVRLMCRQGTLKAKKVGHSWFPTVTAVHQEVGRRAERRTPCAGHCRCTTPS